MVRCAASGELLGRVEAMLDPGIAEIGLVFAAQHWGRGFASQPLSCLHEQLHGLPGVASIWATTHPANLRGQALLLCAGYQRLEAALRPPLYSFDGGDRLFRRRCGPAAKATAPARLAPGAANRAT